jgi:hypothetical protein
LHKVLLLASFFKAAGYTILVMQFFLLLAEKHLSLQHQIQMLEILEANPKPVEAPITKTSSNCSF